MISTAELREFRPDFENMCQIFEYTCRYPNSANSEISNKKITEIIQNNFSFVEKLQLSYKRHGRTHGLLETWSGREKLR